MSNRKPYRPIITGVSYLPEVLKYLNELREEDLDRSALINRIVREHARRRRSGEDRLPTVVRKGRVAGVGAVYRIVGPTWRTQVASQASIPRSATRPTRRTSSSTSCCATS